MTSPLSGQQLQDIAAAVQAQLGPPSIGEGFPSPVSQLFQAGGTVLINTSGLFVYNGTPAAGNLIASIAPAGGLDPYGNLYPQGINVAAGSISGTAIIASVFTAGTTVINSAGLFQYSS